jgi:hypothetical protein
MREKSLATLHIKIRVINFFRRRLLKSPLQPHFHVRTSVPPHYRFPCFTFKPQFVLFVQLLLVLVSSLKKALCNWTVVQYNTVYFGELSWSVQSYLGQDSPYSEVSCVFSLSLQKDAGILAQATAIPSQFFPVHYPLITLPFNGM